MTATSVNTSASVFYLLTERVILDDRGIQVTYPAWVPSFWRQGWFLPWSELSN